MKKREASGCLAVILMCLTTVFGLFLVSLSTVFVFGFAYLGGMILRYFAGNYVVEGLNLIFNTTRFTYESIPLLCGTIATIASFFKSSSSKKE